MQIFVQPLLAQKGLFSVDVPVESDVGDLKTAIEATGILKKADQVIVVRGKILGDEARLSAQKFGGSPAVVLCSRIIAEPTAAPVAGMSPVAAPATMPTGSSPQISPRVSPGVSPRDRGADAGMPDPRSLPRVVPVEAFPVNPAALQMMVEMGFPERPSRKALLLNRMDVERAAAWLLEHMDDGEADGPMMPHQLQRLAAMYQGDMADAGMPPAATPQALLDAIEAGVCTFAVTGPRFAPQTWVHCFTCGLIGDKGCCMACAKVCHAGHKLSIPKPTGSFFCDCGAGALPSCVCKAVTRGGPQRRGDDDLPPPPDATA